MNAFLLGMRSVNPAGAAQIHHDQFLVRSGPGRRCRQGADRPGLRHHHPAHRFADAAAGRRRAAASRPSARRPTWRSSRRHSELSANVNVWGPYYIKRIQDVARRHLEEQRHLGRLSTGMLKMSPFANMPDDVKALAQQTVDDISSGKNKIFVGPLDRSGRHGQAARRPGDGRRHARRPAMAGAGGRGQAHLSRSAIVSATVCVALRRSSSTSRSSAACPRASASERGPAP